MRFVTVMALLLQGCAASAAVVVSPASPGAASQAAVEAASKDVDAGDYAGAHAKLLAAFREDVRDPALMVLLAETELMTGRVQAAADHLEIARVWSGGDVRLLFWSALAEKAAGSDDEAARLLEQALAAAGSDETALYDLAEEFLRKGAVSVSAAIYEKILRLRPAESQFDIFSCLQLASWYGLLGRNNEAAQIMRRARRPMEFGDVDVLAPQESTYWIAVFEGLDLIEKGSFDEGLDRLRQAAAYLPAGVVADAFVVRKLYEKGRRDEAAAVFALVSRRLKDALSADPESASAYHDLALLSVLSGLEKDKGLEYCRWALSLAPLTPQYLDTEAALLLDLGRYSESLRALERALTLVSMPRWSEPGFSLTLAWRRLDILERSGTPVPAAFRTLR